MSLDIIYIFCPDLAPLDFDGGILSSMFFSMLNVIHSVIK